MRILNNGVWQFLIQPFCCHNIGGNCFIVSDFIQKYSLKSFQNVQLDQCKWIRKTSRPSYWRNLNYWRKLCQQKGWLKNCRTPLYKIIISQLAQTLQSCRACNFFGDMKCTKVLYFNPTLFVLFFIGWHSGWCYYEWRLLLPVSVSSS